MNNIRESILKTAQKYLEKLEGALCASLLCFKTTFKINNFLKDLKDNDGFIFIYSANRKYFTRGFIITTNGIYIKKPKDKEFISFDEFKNCEITKNNYHIYLGNKKLIVANNDVNIVFSFLKKLQQYKFPINSIKKQKVNNKNKFNKKIILDIQNKQLKIEEELNFLMMIAKNLEKLSSTLNSSK
jgi:hypothetical protein